MKQAGLAAAIGAYQAGQRAGLQAEPSRLEPARDGEASGCDESGHRLSLHRICATIHRKKGAPRRAVTTPIGNVRPSGATRPVRSAAQSTPTPIRAANRKRAV